jgi:type 1 glutamine amidotransferase
MKARITLLALPAIAALGLATTAISQTTGTLPGGVSVDRPRIPGQNLAGMRVYLRAGLKTHGEGQHDYPQFLADWSKLLTTRGAVVDGSFHAPSAAELAQTDVVVMYKGDAGYMDAAEQAALDAFVQRGGGLVLMHDAMCGPDPAKLASYVGGAKKHGEVNYTLETNVPLTIVDKASPIMKGMTNISLPDEAFYKMTWADKPGIHVLATTVISDTPAARRGGGVGQTVPQVWTYEHNVPGGTKPARSFVWMQGHSYANLAQPQIQAMLLRGIAWAAHRPVDELVNYKAPPRPERPLPAAVGGTN